MDHVKTLCSHFELPDSFGFGLENKSAEEIIVEFLMYTRRRKHIITFQKIHSLVKFDIDEVLLLLSQHRNYTEASYEEIINGHLIQLRLTYREGCITKALYKAWGEDGCPFTNICACLVITYELLERQVFIEEIINVFLPKFQHLRLKKVKNKIKEMKSKGFKNIQTNNNYAKNVLKKL